LATLSANVGDVRQAFFLGIRWGLGHSTGLLLVGVILIALDAANNTNSDDDTTTIHVPDNVSHFFESLVGIFMLLLGAYGIQRAWEKRPKVYTFYDFGADILPSSSASLSISSPSSSPSSHEDNGGASSSAAARTSLPSTTETSLDGEGLDELESAAAATTVAAASIDIEESYQNHTATQYLSEQQQRQQVEHSPLSLHADCAGVNDDAGNEEEIKSPFLLANTNAHSHHHHHHHFSGPNDDDDWDANDEVDSSSSYCWSIRRYSRRISTRTLAVCAGIVHGLAGPGGVLGIIPAVQLHSGKLATIYLTSFCLASTLTMGQFAILYGTCTNRLGAAAAAAAGSRQTVQRVQEQQGQGAASMSSTAAAVSPVNHSNTQCEFLIEVISAFLSILVGITWLTLLSIGKLEDVFP
jgi:hypothetical protein